MNILTPILSSKYFFQICGSQTFPCQGPPKFKKMYLAADPTSRKRSFQGPPETENSVKKRHIEMMQPEGGLSDPTPCEKLSELLFGC